MSLIRPYLRVGPMTWVAKRSIQGFHINSFAVTIMLTGSTPDTVLGTSYGTSQTEHAVFKYQFPSYYEHIVRHVTENSDAPVSTTDKEERFIV